MDHQLRLIWSRRLGIDPEEIEDDSNFFERNIYPSALSPLAPLIFVVLQWMVIR